MELKPLAVAIKTKLEDTKAKLEAEDFANLTKDDILETVILQIKLTQKGHFYSE